MVHLNAKRLLDRDLPKRLLIVVAGMAAVVGIIVGAAYLGTPRVSYRVSRLDCSASAIAARNQAAQTPNEDACIIQLTVTNRENKLIELDYENVHGGPAGGGPPDFRIYNHSGDFCYANPTDNPEPGLAAKTSATLTLTCDDTYGKDPYADADPAYILIDYNLLSRVRVSL